jgi:signal transduction histidine kinase
MSAVAVDAQSQEALVGGLAHDLRNALLVIRGYSALLKPGLRDPDQLRDVEEIEKATDRAAELTVGLIDAARRYAAE